VLQLGHPGLRLASRPVADPTSRPFRAAAERLMDVLERFRGALGFGRAIAAPQIGVAERFVALNLGEGPFVIANPVITWRSPQTFTLWDDCMSFPDLLVRVRRHASISVRYLDLDGRVREWPELERSRSELLQHELDHLDGILAVDRALDRDALVSRRAFGASPEWFKGQVDYATA